MKGRALESVLDELGIKEEVYAVASKRALALQLTDAMQERRLSKKGMAAKMPTSRTQLERLLDPEDDRVRLDTIMKAASVLGTKVKIEMVDIHGEDRGSSPRYGRRA